jgi:hypothetical protein
MICSQAMHRAVMALAIVLLIPAGASADAGLYREHCAKCHARAGVLAKGLKGIDEFPQHRASRLPTSALVRPRPLRIGPRIRCNGGHETASEPQQTPPAQHRRFPNSLRRQSLDHNRRCRSTWADGICEAPGLIAIASPGFSPRSPPHPPSAGSDAMRLAE